MAHTTLQIKIEKQDGSDELDLYEEDVQFDEDDIIEEESEEEIEGIDESEEVLEEDGDDLIDDNYEIVDNNVEYASDTRFNDDEFEFEILGYTETPATEDIRVHNRNRTALAETPTEPQFDYRCEVCGVDSETFKKTLAHYKKKHDIAGYIRCCGLKFRKKELVDDHIKWHSQPDIFKCKFCDKKMGTKASLHKHTSIEHRKKEEEFICDICDERFSRKEIIRYHINSVHSNPFQCKPCQMRFSTPLKLEIHNKLHHTEDGPEILRNQLESIKGMNSYIHPKKLNAGEVEEVMACYFDMNCDVCGEALSSLQEAQFHYMEEHHISDGYLKCCGVTFRSNETINKHILFHLKPEFLKCQICELQYKSLIGLRAHLNIHLAHIEGKFKCKKCNKNFSRKSHYISHTKIHHGIIKKANSYIKKPEVSADEVDIGDFFNMNCDECPTTFTFTSFQHAKLHYFEEHGNIDGYITCCHTKFKTMKQVSDHLQFHLNPDINKCHICGKSYTSMNVLRTHISKHKAKARARFCCDHCGNTFTSNYYLNQHVTKTHLEPPKPPSIPCSRCNRLFATVEAKDAHEKRIHDAVKLPKNHMCEICAKTFSHRRHVLTHIKQMHADSDQSERRQKVQCTICDSWLSNRYTLKTHMQNHSSEPQKCPQCDKVSPNHHALMCHIKEVHTIPKFQCEHCDKRFKMASALKDHMATHTGKKLYRCSYCSESFVWRPNMYSHQKKAHPDEWNADKTRRELAKKGIDLNVLETIKDEK